MSDTLSVPTQKPAATYHIIGHTISHDGLTEIDEVKIALAEPFNGFTDATITLVVPIDDADRQIRERVCWRLKQDTWLVYHPNELSEVLDEEPAKVEALGLLASPPAYNEREVKLADDAIPKPKKKRKHK